MWRMHCRIPHLPAQSLHPAPCMGAAFVVLADALALVEVLVVDLVARRRLRLELVPLVLAQQVRDPAEQDFPAQILVI